VVFFINYKKPLYIFQNIFYLPMANINKKGQGMVGFVMGIVVLTIVIATVAIPIVSDSTVNLTGTEATVIGTVSVLLAVLLIVMIARAY